MAKINQMYCEQCQEAAGGKACTRMAMCGKEADVAALQDLLIYVTKGTAALATELRYEKKSVPLEINHLVADNLVMTAVNVNFDREVLKKQIALTLGKNQSLAAQAARKEKLRDASTWYGTEEEYEKKAAEVGVLATEDEDIRSLRELIVYALKGIAAYIGNAARLGKEDREIDAFVQNALAKTLDDHLNGGELIATVLEAGRFGIRATTLLKNAREEAYGKPEAIEVDTGVRSNPGILVGGDNMKDLADLLAQAEGSGVDVYTYSDLISAHAYPKLKAYTCFAGNYGGAWWRQKEDFRTFRGPILMTSDELVPPRKDYIDRLYTTGLAGYPGCEHIEVKEDGSKDFSAIIERAKSCEAPEELNHQTVMTGYGEDQLIALGEKVANAYLKKDVRKLVVTIGTDGRSAARNYYHDFVKALPEDTIVLTAGSVKYRFNTQDLGEVAGIPRLLDAGDAADAQSVIEFLLSMQERMNINDVSLLPVYYNVSWYDHKSIITLLDLLYVGIKNIYIGPTTLTFLSDGIREVLANYFNIYTIGDADEDVKNSFGERGDGVTADMIVGDIVAQYPELIPTMLSVGLHCLGCGVSQMETLKEACEVHGLDPYDILEVLNDELKHPAEAGGAQ